MTETTPPAGTRGAVDLSAVTGATSPTSAPAGGGMLPGAPVPGAPAGAAGGPAGGAAAEGGPGGPGVPPGLVVEVDATNLQDALT